MPGEQEMAKDHVTDADNEKVGGEVSPDDTLKCSAGVSLVPAAGADQEEEEDEVRQEARTANRSETCASKPRRRTPNGAALLPLLRTMFPNGLSGRGPRTQRRPSLASCLLSPPVFRDTERSWPPSPKARRARHGLPDQHGWYIFRSRMDPGETSSTCAPFGGVRFRSLPKE
jgi:hypothetical protein